MSPGRGAATPADAGFTLLELLIALVVFSLLMTLLVNGLQLTGKSWRTVHAHTTHRMDLRAARQALRRQLQQVVPYAEPKRRSGMPRILFEGTGTSITFVGRLPEHAGGMMQRFQLTRIDQNLELRLGSIKAQSDDQEAWSETLILLDGIKEVTFGYFDDHAAEGEQWIDTWRDRILLPRAIKVDVEWDDDGRDGWPPLIVRPWISCHVSC
jgi:type II secretion system protein J